MECRGSHGIGHAERQCPTAHPKLNGSGKGKGKEDGYGKGKGKGEGKGSQGKGGWSKGGKGHTCKSSTYSFNESSALSFRRGNPSGGGWGRGWETWGGDSKHYKNNGGYTRQLGFVNRLTLLHPLTSQTETTTAAALRQRR